MIFLFLSNILYLLVLTGPTLRQSFLGVYTQLKDLASILPRNAVHRVHYAVTRCLSVRLSVRLSHAGIVSKRLNVSSAFSHRRVATPLWFVIANVIAVFLRDPLMGAWNRDFRPISRFALEMIQERVLVTI